MPARAPALGTEESGEPMLHVIPMVVALGSAPGVACAPLTDLPATAERSSARSVVFREHTASLEAYYRDGVPWRAFHAATKARKQLWEENWTQAAVPSDLLSRARAVPGTWRILVIAIDTCSDSVSTIPYIAKLVESVPGLDMRIIDPDRGRPLMEARRTPDGRAATPTVILLDERYEEVGCWIERPATLQTWYLEEQKTTPVRELTGRKMEWYRTDAGVETLREMVTLLEAAAAGQRGCVTAGDAR